MPIACSTWRRRGSVLCLRREHARCSETDTSFVKFVREHHFPSFLEYGEYPYVTADEVKKALKAKAAFSTMLDQMQ